MPSSALQGLNIVDIVDTNNEQNDSSNTAPFADLDAQLELWTNLAFQSDEPFIPRPLSPSLDYYNKQLDVANVANSDTNNPDIDMSRFLAGFGIDPFLVPPPNAAILDPNHLSAIIPPLPDQLATPSSSSPTSSQPPNKRMRTRKVPDISPIITADDSKHTPDQDTADSPGPESPNTTTPVNIAEDKRRRNTAASARFRAKKKEREAALEKKSKELEGRVGELERECEALRRENGWLKGLVVGVTNAGSTTGTKRRRVDSEALEVKEEALKT